MHVAEIKAVGAVVALGDGDVLALEDVRVALHTLLATGIETLAQRMGWTMRCRTQRVRHTATTSNKREAAMLFVQNLLRLRLLRYRQTPMFLKRVNAHA